MRYLALILFISLGACAPRAPITQPIVAMNFSNAERQSQVTALDVAEVRARVRTDDGNGELIGVPCRLTGPGYTANFTTPAALELPTFGNTAPRLAISCEYEGETRSTTMTARNESAEERERQRRQLLNDLEDGARVSLFVGLRLSGRRGFDEFNYINETLTFRR